MHGNVFIDFVFVIVLDLDHPLSLPEVFLRALRPDMI
jgi:hypothetical protein